jgi:hypothetical protein
MPTLSQTLSIQSVLGGFAAPINVTATASGTANDRTITANWDAPADAPNTYDVEYAYNGGAFTGTQSISHPTTTYDFTGQDVMLLIYDWRLPFVTWPISMQPLH